MTAVERHEADVLVVGSGAGGATVAATLAESGRDVLVVEEGPPVPPRALSTHSPEAMLALYRNGGLSPLLGRQSIAFVEGRCVGGSTEINSAFWHRLPADAAERYRSVHGLDDLDEAWHARSFEELEQSLKVTRLGAEHLPPSSLVFGRGLERLGAPAVETPRAQAGDPGGTQFAAGAKQSMSRTWLPRAAHAGARLLAGVRVRRLRIEAGRAVAALCERDAPDRSEGRPRPVEIRFRTVFVCGGATQTPALLRRSGLRGGVGGQLRIQPMVKVAAEFEERLDAHRSVMPVYQLRDPASSVFLGGSVFTPGFLGLTLADRWPENAEALARWRHMGLYYAACRGTGHGSVRAFPGTGEAVARYALSREDRRNLAAGLLRLCDVLFAGGAVRIYPGLRGCPPVESPDHARAVLGSGDGDVARMSLSTVHVTSSVPMGAGADAPVAPDGCARGVGGVRVADASALPEPPGVNPQGTVMALALRAARIFLGV